MKSGISKRDELGIILQFGRVESLDQGQSVHRSLSLKINSWSYKHCEIIQQIFKQHSNKYNMVVYTMMGSRMGSGLPDSQTWFRASGKIRNSVKILIRYIDEHF